MSTPRCTLNFHCVLPAMSFILAVQVEQPGGDATPAPAAAPAATPVAPGAPAPAAAPAGGDAMLEDVEDEELRLALALSMQDAGPESEKKDG